MINVFAFAEKVIYFLLPKNILLTTSKYKPNCRPLKEELRCIHCYAHFCWPTLQGSTKSVLEETAVWIEATAPLHCDRIQRAGDRQVPATGNRWSVNSRIGLCFNDTDIWNIKGFPWLVITEIHKCFCWGGNQNYSLPNYSVNL